MDICKMYNRQELQRKARKEMTGLYLTRFSVGMAVFAIFWVVVRSGI